MLDKYRGCIVGLAVGDAMGYPTEFRSRRQTLEAFPPDGVTGFVGVNDPAWSDRPVVAGPDHPPGTYSDDTQMTVALAEGLLEAETDERGARESLDAVMAAIGERFVAWSASPENNRAPGNTCMTGCRNLKDGVPWREAGVEWSKGCGSTMRVAPVGLYYADRPDRLLKVARASSVLTHGHDAGIEGAAAAALLVALALQGAGPREMYDRLMDECSPNSDDFHDCLATLPDLLDSPPADVLCEDGLGEAWVAEEAVASALYCFWRSPEDFETTVLTAANTDGDSDSIACIAGSISGAYNGLRAIPETWRDQVENSDQLHSLGARLYARRP